MINLVTFFLLTNLNLLILYLWHCKAIRGWIAAQSTPVCYICCFVNNSSILNRLCMWTDLCQVALQAPAVQLYISLPPPPLVTMTSFRFSPWSFLPLASMSLLLLNASTHLPTHPISLPLVRDSVQQRCSPALLACPLRASIGPIS